MIKRSVSWFAIIGALAALIHYVVAVVLELTHLASPAMANVIGFTMAFPVSYLGHTKLSFAGHTATHGQALPKFFGVALTGFLINQGMLLNVLRITTLPFWFVLGVVMVLVAISTYILSRFWAFKGQP
jgi:putative flippase GtrA